MYYFEDGFFFNNVIGSGKRNDNTQRKRKNEDQLSQIEELSDTIRNRRLNSPGFIRINECKLTNKIFNYITTTTKCVEETRGDIEFVATIQTWWI